MMGSRHFNLALFGLVALISLTILSYFGYSNFPPLNPYPDDPNHFHYNDKNLQLCTERNDCPSLVEWLHSEAEAGHIKAVKELLAKGVDVNGFTSEGTAAIHVAVAKDHEGVVKVLLDAKADVNLATIPREDRRTDPYAPTTIGWTALHIVAATGNDKLISFLLKRGADVRASALDGAKPLHYAAQFGHEKVLKRLLDSGAEIDSRNIMGATPLLYAASDGQVNACKLLLQHGSDCNAAMIDGRTALWVAANRNRETLVEILLSAGASVNAEFNGATVSENAAENFRWDILERLLEAGGKLRKAWYSSTHHTAAQILASASRDSREKIVRLLLSEEPDLDAINNALVEAAYKTNTNIIKILINAGADVNAKSPWNGESALYIAAKSSESTEVVAILIAAGADVNVRVPSSGQTPLHAASSNGHEKIVKELLDAGVEIDAKTIEGETSLYIASHSYFEVVQMLLRGGADPGLTKNDGRTPLHNAAESNNVDIINVILATCQNVDAKSENGETPLHCAASRGYESTVEPLLNAGADPNSKNENGTTPIEKTKRPPVMELLLAAGATVIPDGVMKISLWAAVTQQYINILGALLKRGKDPNDPRERLGSTQNTPLHQAAWVGNVKITKMLLAAGADVSATNTYGETPLALAEKRGNEEVAKLLRGHN
jgi:ankyrin repeat protein